MNKTRLVKIVIGLWALLFIYSAVSNDWAKHVIADEVSGVVIDKETGKPIPNAIVAMRFERGNTGHGSPHCFRSLAVQADEQGRFKFAPWSQEKTMANNTYGEIVVHRPGYNLRPGERLIINQASREFLGVRFSNDIRIPKTVVKIELGLWVGTDEERISQITKLAADFSCHWQSYSNSLLIAQSVYEEAKTNSAAGRKDRSLSNSRMEIIEHIIADSQRSKNF